MVQLNELYDADLAAIDPTVRSLRANVRAPHPLHGVPYADGVLLCGRGNCTPCHDYRAAYPQSTDQVRWTKASGPDAPLTVNP